MLSRPHTSELSPMYNAHWSDDDDTYTVIPSGYRLPTPLNTIHHNWMDPNNHQNSLLQHYMKHVLPIQFSHAEGSIDIIVWTLIHSSNTAREAACLLADLHLRSTTQSGSIGYNTPEDRDVYRHAQRAMKPVTEGDAFASLCMVSYLRFSGGQWRWQAFLDGACRFSLALLEGKHTSPASALMSCTESMRFIIKTSMWFDVLASATQIRRPMFEVLHSLYDPSGIALVDGRPELSMMDVMGCDTNIVIALAEIAGLAYWKEARSRTGSLSVPELVRRGQRIEAILNNTNVNNHSHGAETEKSRRRRLTSDVFRSSALVYLHSVLSGDHPLCPEILYNVTETIKCLGRTEDVGTARHVVRSVVFSICVCGCLTDDPAFRGYFLQLLQELQMETVGNCALVCDLMRRVWTSREGGTPVDWRVVMREILLV
ncbi:fungal-specific transcription factor domain-containing protein [Suillus clintonianus]|uniref:fungal-specific transcription factor domain-containing protein n=1 Tax=Suillus clintonianus TaxID=1904413 RepID=UPI001B8773F4|nr:fungal-specific transcription factor domain-containing protein [Suillus clintonianus]KAG2154034.1 fungal-specific transcription factor domain-containing protein [Suillus clintonianus]